MGRGLEELNCGLLAAREIVYARHEFAVLISDQLRPPDRRRSYHVIVHFTSPNVTGILIIRLSAFVGISAPFMITVIGTSPRIAGAKTVVRESISGSAT